MFKLIVLAAFVACASSLAVHPPSGAFAYPGYAGAYHAPVVAPVAAAYPYGAYHAPVVAAPVVKAIAPVATSYANTYKVSSSYTPVVKTIAPAYAAPIAYGAAYHAPIAAAAYIH